MDNFGIAPGAQTADAIGCNVVSTPTGLHGPCELRAIIQRLEKVSRRVLSRAVFKPGYTPQY